MVQFYYLRLLQLLKLYTNVKVITISSINALKTLPSDGRVTLEEIDEPNIIKTTAAAIIPPII